MTSGRRSSGRSLKRRVLLRSVPAFAAGMTVASAQQAGRVYRVGSLHQSPVVAPHHVAFYDELRLLGFREGQNLEIDRAGYGLEPDRMAEHASVLAKMPVDVMLCGGDLAVRATRQAPGTIPVVAVTDDIVGAGFTRSIAKPDSNVTGISILANELDGKRQELLIEGRPGISRMAALADSATTTAAKAQVLVEQARARGIDLSIHWLARAPDIAGAVDAAHQAGAQAINVLATPLLFNYRRLVLERVDPLRLPAMYQWPETAEDGGLFAYGPRIAQVYRQAAHLVAKIFKGAKAADVPIEQPTRFELVVNLKAAKAIGHEIPARFLARADLVIE